LDRQQQINLRAESWFLIDMICVRETFQDFGG
jgi:hypothetical protein